MGILAVRAVSVCPRDWVARLSWEEPFPYQEDTVVKYWYTGQSASALRKRSLLNTKVHEFESFRSSARSNLAASIGRPTVQR